jgi:hypothetical protein
MYSYLVRVSKANQEILGIRVHTRQKGNTSNWSVGLLGRTKLAVF